MKKLQVIVMLLFIFGALSLNAQQKKYISYTVQKGETLKSLAKIYKISTRDLSRLNPGVKRKPKRKVAKPKTRKQKVSRKRKKSPSRKVIELG